MSRLVYNAVFHHHSDDDRDYSSGRAWDAALTLCKQHNLKVSFKDQKVWNTWNGRWVYKAGLRDAEQLIHELAHWLVASPLERRMPEFGLGSNPVALNGEVDGYAYQKADSFQSIDQRRRERIEKMAGVLTVLLVDSAGLPLTQTLQENLSTGSITNFDLKSNGFFKGLMALHRKGLLDRNMNFTF